MVVCKRKASIPAIIQGADMSDFTLWEQLHSEWLSIKVAYDFAQKEVDDQMQIYLLSKGKRPRRKMVHNADHLCHQSQEARDELNQFIHAHCD
jgi:hypothetical protein